MRIGLLIAVVGVLVGLSIASLIGFAVVGETAKQTVKCDDPRDHIALAVAKVNRC